MSGLALPFRVAPGITRNLDALGDKTRDALEEDNLGDSIIYGIGTRMIYRGDPEGEERVLFTSTLVATVGDWTVKRPISIWGGLVLASRAGNEIIYFGRRPFLCS